MLFLSSSRSVLLMGDEGLQIFLVKKTSVTQVAFLPWDTHEFEASACDIIIKKCGSAPLVILNDMVEQHYRKENVPKVSIIDRGSVVDRRLNVAFPSYKVRAALKLKDKKSASAGDQKGTLYLFAAMPSSDHFNKLIEVVRMSLAPIVGFFLLPVESSDMVRKITLALAHGKGFKPTWTIFIGQHHNGGVRQIVTRNGELALTRLTPIVDTDIEPDLWAKEISNELNSTMSYLTRFGYKATDGLDIIITANDSAKTALQGHINVEADLHIMNAREIAKIVGCNIGKQEDLRYADPIHVAYSAFKKSYLIPLKSVAIDNLVKPRKIAAIVTGVLILGAAYSGYSATKNIVQAASIQNQLLISQQKRQALEQEYALELEKRKRTGFDFLLVNNSIAIFNELEKTKIDPLPVIWDVDKALGVDIHLDRFTIELAKKDLNLSDLADFSYNSNASNEDESKYYEAVLTLSFPSTIGTDVSVGRVNGIKDKLAENPDYEVKILKQVADLSYTGNYTEETGRSIGNATPENYEAQIQIRGKVK